MSGLLTLHQADLKKPFPVAFRVETVTGIAVVGLALLGTSDLYILYGDVDSVVGFGFRANLISLFARVCGGIFTKAALHKRAIPGFLDVFVPLIVGFTPAPKALVGTSSSLLSQVCARPHDG